MDDGNDGNEANDVPTATTATVPPMSHLSLVFPLLLVPPLLGQAPSAAVERGASSITESAVARRIRIIADDSMGGRDTPSRGLELTAQYVANEFRRLGLQPGGDSGTYLQRYPLTVRRLLVDQSDLRFTRSGGKSFTLSFSSTVALASNSKPDRPVGGGVVLVAGPWDSVAAAGAGLGGRVAVWVADWSAGFPSEAQRVVAGLSRAGVALVIAPVNNPGQFERLHRSRSGDQVTLGPGGQGGRGGQGGPLFLLVAEPAITAEVPETSAQFTQLRGATTLTLQPLPDWQAEATVRDTVITDASAPNAVGILPGSDPLLQREYLVFSAHMDHVGSRCGGTTAADTICNGADDDASGTVGVVELAEAFAHAGARPRRSLIFLTVSGEERGLWGSQRFTQNPPVPIKSIVADLNMDMIGRNWKDTIVAIGKEHSDLGKTLARVNRGHPELHMTAVDDRWPAESFYTRSDHFNFARRGVPILFFFNGTHEDYHRASDSPDKIDAEKEARILRLVYYLGQEVGNAPARPQWNRESYKAIVTSP